LPPDSTPAKSEKQSEKQSEKLSEKQSEKPSELLLDMQALEAAVADIEQFMNQDL
jgi:hypothetical protein